MTWSGESMVLNVPVEVWILLGGAPLVASLWVTGQLDAATPMAAGSDMMARLMGVSKVAGAIFLLFAAFNIVMGVGFWKQCKWARIIGLILASSNLVSLLFVPISLFLLEPLVLYAGITYYMLRREVKNSFGTVPPTA